MLKKTILSIICAGIILLVPYTAIAGNSDPPFEDPDGPTQGGLDDLKDLEHLAIGVGIIVIVRRNIDINDIPDIDGIIELILYLSPLGYFSYRALIHFLEAFDIREIVRDGL